VRIEASTKPQVHQKFEIFWTNITSTMACPMSKNGPKKGLCPLGVNPIDKYRLVIVKLSLINLVGDRWD
jgi:hypothetical protein